MKFCGSHWDKLRAAIDARGLTPLVSSGGQSVVDKMVDQLQTNKATLDNYDPLMAAHWSIASNAMRMLSGAGMNPLYLMASGDEEPVYPARAGEKYKGRTWSRCPLCYMNLAHEISCTDPACRLEKETGYDWMIDRAADDAKTFVDEQLAGGQS